MLGFRKHGRLCAACGALLLAVLCAACAAYMGIWPQLGDKIQKKGPMTVDSSHAGEGYIQVKAKSSKALKLRISHGDTTYTYDLTGEDEYEVFPLQMGSGSYTCALYEKVKGNRYSQKAKIKLSVTLEDEQAPFLCPSQYVWYTQDSPAVAAATEICQGLSTDREKVSAVRDYMVQGFAYDYVRALTISETYLGDVDGCFESRMGLCQDLAVVVACMLRSQGVPTQVVIGYVDQQYHAWNNVYVDGSYKRLDITAALSGFSSGRVYTAERYY